MPRTFVQPPVVTFPLGHVRRPHRCTPSLLTAAAALACASPAHAQCPATFAAAFNYPGGTNCQSVAIGDFNGDGRSDLAADPVHEEFDRGGSACRCAPKLYLQ